MNLDIRPLTPDDLPELSRILIAGFHAPPDADFAAPEVLRWKYLEPLGPQVQEEGNQGVASIADGPRSYIARDEAGQFIGHIGPGGASVNNVHD
jgi:hypothetical protein